MTSHQKGFSGLEVLLIVCIIGTIGAVGWFVYSRQTEGTDNQEAASKVNQQETPNHNANQEASTKEEAQYLVIKEWGVKIPLTEATKNATYRMENGYVYLDVAIEGDVNNQCAGQAAVTKVTEPNENADNWRERPSELDKIASKINGVYYFIEGSQAACSDDDTVLNTASTIRTAWLKQGKLIVAE